MAVMHRSWPSMGAFLKEHRRLISRDATSIAEHAEHLRELDGDGKLILAGPFTDDPRGLLVLNCADARAATAILDVDPLVVAGVRTYRVHSWLIANADNGYTP
jgi:uncharacterized protein YciI